MVNLEQIEKEEEQLRRLYDAVFNPDGSVKNCGRQACIELMEFLEDIYSVRGSFGNTKTGHMNMPQIKMSAGSLLQIYT